MVRSVGKALETALKDKDAASGEPRRKGGSVFSNSRRRDVFSTLTLSPCVGASEIAHRTLINVNTVVWHIDRLIEPGYIVERRIGRRRIFFPEGMVGPDEVPLFLTLNKHACGLILSLVLGNPGNSQMELSKISGMSHQSISKIMKQLEDVGLMSRISDGSHIRHYPTKLLSDRSEEYYDRSKNYAQFILKKLYQDEGVEPVIVKRGLERMILELGPRKKRYTMEVGINPYMTAL